MWLTSFTLCCILQSFFFAFCQDHLYEVPCRPEQVHIAFGDNVKEMVIMWSTIQECTTEVRYGTDPWDFSNNIAGEMKHFDDASNTKGLHCLHRVKLQNLIPNKTYFYRPISKGISSGPYYFRTPPSEEQMWVPEFLVYGDLGLQSDSIPYLNSEILKGTYTAAFHVGDFAYDLHYQNGQSTDMNNTCFEETGDQFMRILEDFASRLPYMTAPGNHEIVADTFSHYRYRFSMPSTLWPIPIEKMWYSIDIGPVHFVSYSTEVFFTNQEAYVDTQKNWLMGDLKSANDNRKKVPWVVAFGHRPMYCSNDDVDDCTKADSKVRAGLEDLFFTYGVDVVLQAHEHSYERLWPMYKGKVLQTNYTDPKAPVQITTGAAGSREGIDIEKNDTADWSAFRRGNSSLNSFGRLKAVNATHLFWEQLSIKSLQVLDSLWIVQHSHGPFSVPKSMLPTTTATVEHVKIQDGIAHNTNTGSSDTSHASIVKVDASSNGEHHVVDTADQSSSSSKNDSFLDSTKGKIGLGVGCGVLLLVCMITALIIRHQKAKSRKYRRWDETVDYGRKFYSGYAHIQNGDKGDLDAEDFEVEVTDGNPTSKLLSE